MLLHWDIYEITAPNTALHGIKLRGRIRKLAIEAGINCLVENATDQENVVRFAIEAKNNPDDLYAIIKGLLPDASINCVLQNIPNPVLSKLKVNMLERYES